MLRLLTVATIAGVAVCLCGCDTPSESTSSTTKAVVTLTGNPNPALAQPSTGKFYKVAYTTDKPDEYREYDWVASFGVTLTETGGVGLDITALSVKEQQAAGGIITPPTGGDVERYEYVSSSSGNRLEGNNSAVVNFTVWYDNPNLRRDAVVTVSFTFYDKKTDSSSTDDIAWTQSLDVRVQ
jgi:hypothetical protein